MSCNRMETGGLVLIDYSDKEDNIKSLMKVTPYCESDNVQNHDHHPKMQKPEFAKNLYVTTCFNDDDQLETPDITSDYYHCYTPVATHTLFNEDKLKMGRYYKRKFPLKLIIQRAMVDPMREENLKTLKPSTSIEESDLPLHRRSVMGILIGVLFGIRKSKSNAVAPCVE